MRAAARIAFSLAVVAAASLLFYALQHQLTSIWMDVTLRPDVREALRESLDDQKKLYAADPARGPEYRARFERTRKLLARMEVLDLSRAELVRRYELLLVAAFAIALLAAGIATAARRRRDERRLEQVQSALHSLSRGDTAIRLGDRRRDAIGRIARMIEETSDLVAGQRRRLEYLEHLSTWQEAARRHAHEIRTPLTAARLEIDRLVSQSLAHAAERELHATRDSVFEELDRLARFTKEFSSFAAIGEPALRVEPLEQIVEEFTSIFANAWPQLTLATEMAGEHRVAADRDLIRRVLANLCSNSALAVGERGVVTFRIRANGDDNGAVHLDVHDDGHGIDPTVRARLFEPYVTTRRVGEGMGLGLAISRKILLDHGGDLELLGSSPSFGTTFRLTLPAPRAEASA
jgi:two-component system nitrogen regulation sensor histidine kinase NtrY